MNQNIKDFITKSFTQPTAPTTAQLPSGLQTVDFSVLAGSEVIVDTPFRNATSRSAGERNTTTGYQVITGVNKDGIGLAVGEGLRGGLNSFSLRKESVFYKSFGMDDELTEEAQNSTNIDLLGLAGVNLLSAVMIEEEKLIIGGNASKALGKAVAPVLVAEAGGSLVADDYVVKVVALAHKAYAPIKGLDVAEVVLREKIVRRTHKGDQVEPAGVGVISNGTSVTVTAGAKIKASVERVNYAVAYAWFVNDKLEAITDTNSVEIADLVEGQALGSLFQTDNSVNENEFDGLLVQLYNPANNATIKSMNGLKLTANKNSIEQFDDVLTKLYKKRVSPDKIFTSEAGIRAIKEALKAGGSTYMYQEGQALGDSITQYRHPITGKILQIVVHQDIPNIFLFYTEKMPMPVGGKVNTTEMLLRKDYNFRYWPENERKKEIGLYFDGVYVVRAPYTMAIIDNFSV